MPLTYASLSTELQQELDDLEHENEKAVLVAFGSALNLNPENMHELWSSLTRALDNNIIQRVYWGIGKTSEPPNESHPKVRFMKWTPQQAMLNHPAVSLFVTHSGAESIHEAIYEGVPMLAIPFFGDQPGNAVRIAELGIAHAHSKLELNEYDLYKSVIDLVEDPQGQVRKQVDRMKHIARRQSRIGIQHASELVETIAEVGSEHLLPPRYSWLQRTIPQWDVLTALILLSYVTYQSCRFLMCFVFSKANAKMKTE
jgi:UDP:flavonoid glycosyltransferase YjiC (YdhE family)